MSILDSNKIDLVGTDKTTDEVVLTIADDLSWENNLLHLEALQEKLNTYIEFIEGGQIISDYPDSNGKKLRIEIVSKYEYNDEGLSFLEKVRPIISSIGADIMQRTLNR